MAIALDPARIAVGGGLMSRADAVLAALERRLSRGRPVPARARARRVRARRAPARRHRARPSDEVAAMSGELMRAEMAEQPDAARAGSPTASTRTPATVRAVLPDPFAGVVFLARGSSDNAAVYGRYLAELAVGPPGGARRPEPAHALRRAASATTASSSSRISQSGETPEIVTVCRRLRRGRRAHRGDRQRRAKPARRRRRRRARPGRRPRARRARDQDRDRPDAGRWPPWPRPPGRCRSPGGELGRHARRGRAPCSTIPSRPTALAERWAQTRAAVRGGARAALRRGARGGAQDQGDDRHPRRGHLGRRPPPRADRRRGAATCRCSRSTAAAPAARGRARGGRRSRASAGRRWRVCGDSAGRGAAAAAGTPRGARGLPGDRARPAARARRWRPPAASTPTRRPGSRRSPQRSERRRNEEQVQQVHVRSACSRGALCARPRGMRRRRRLEHERRRRRRRRQRRRRQDDRAAPARDQDHALRGEGQADLRGQGQGALPRLQGLLPERQPGSEQAAAAGRGRDHQRRERARARRGRRQVGRPDRPAREPEEHPGDRVRPADPRPGHRVLRVVRQRQAGPRPGAVAASTSSARAPRASRS